MTKIYVTSHSQNKPEILYVRPNTDLSYGPTAITFRDTLKADLESKTLDAEKNLLALDLKNNDLGIIGLQAIINVAEFYFSGTHSCFPIIVDEKYVRQICNDGVAFSVDPFPSKSNFEQSLDRDADAIDSYFSKDTN